MLFRSFTNKTNTHHDARTNVKQNIEHEYKFISNSDYDIRISSFPLYVPTLPTEHGSYDSENQLP